MLLLAVIVQLYLFVAIVVLAALRKDYRQVRDTISQLGESGAPRARLTSYGVFLPVGLTLAVIAYRVRSLEADIALLALGLAVGYAGAAVFPCDPGAPRRGSWRQQLHTACGWFEYLAGAYALYRIWRPHGVLSWAPAAIVVLVITASSLWQRWRVRGIAQRVAELTLFVSLALALARTGPT